MTAVWYTGPANRRLITAADWARSGISSDDVEWNAQNGFSIPTLSFTSAQLDLLEDLGQFVTDAPDGPRTGTTIPTPPTSGSGGSLGSTIGVISEIPGLTLMFGPGPLPDPATRPKTVYIVVPT
jgi:hypothetical protein